MSVGQRGYGESVRCQENKPSLIKAARGQLWQGEPGRGVSDPISSHTCTDTALWPFLLTAREGGAYSPWLIFLLKLLVLLGLVLLEKLQPQPPPVC